MTPLVPFGWSLVLTAAHAMVNNMYIEVFLWAVMADLMTGIVKSFTGHAKVKADSSTGLRGLAKHLLIMLLVLTIYPILDVLQFDAISNAVVLFYIAEYAISILENLEVMGFPIPSFLKSRFEKMAETADKEDEFK
ncbi:Xin Secretion/Phage Lysis Holin [Lactobacillus brevis KB290] [Lactiplantibacillus mudanjiangensis]|uniref:phage holin family protein n=1 Tax=Lactiplantibacillus mudanjiangensis TaxID=1296538 RepID=UPI0010145E4D|nr:Xin Secretion/Phage Lysis Holin [Lactobacillus brevis KB290] [Lactiplantibacillus mudanjiangensis]